MIFSKLFFHITSKNFYNFIISKKTTRNVLNAHQLPHTAHTNFDAKPRIYVSALIINFIRRADNNMKFTYN